MKRLAAAIIDVGFIEIMVLILYCILISIWRLVRNVHISYLGSYSRNMLWVLYVLLFLCVSFSYFLVGMVCGKRRTAGKLFMGIQGENGPVKGKYTVVLALLKLLACILYPITILWFLFTGNMPYDFFRKHSTTV